jgi:uncharacterized NAD(P)/FAD-binding protein YdhS
MAKVIMPLLSGEVRGKVGEIVFFKRYGMQLARMRTKPSNPKTEKQMAVRTNLAGLSKLWKGEGNITLKKYNPTSEEWEDVSVADGLTDTERRAWENEARSKGKPMIYARLMFIGENAERLAKGQDIKRTP